MWCIVSATLAALLTVGSALACSCVGNSKSGCEVPSASVIVLARVASIERDKETLLPSAQAGVRSVWGSVTVNLNILEQFHGNPSKSLVVRTETST